MCVFCLFVVFVVVVYSLHLFLINRYLRVALYANPTAMNFIEDKKRILLCYNFRRRCFATFELEKFILSFESMTSATSEVWLLLPADGATTQPHVPSENFIHITVKTLRIDIIVSSRPKYSTTKSGRCLKHNPVSWFS